MRRISTRCMRASRIWGGLPELSHTRFPRLRADFPASRPKTTALQSNYQPDLHSFINRSRGDAPAIGRPRNY
jgi:hypothetical protein